MNGLAAPSYSHVVAPIQFAPKQDTKKKSNAARRPRKTRRKKGLAHD
jgi:hypothetical protein